MSHTHILTFADYCEHLRDVLGADYQTVIAPLRTELESLADRREGDRVSAALRLLRDRQAFHRPVFEQHIVLAALADLSASTGANADEVGDHSHAASETEI